jgi:surfeit locus 1 family protein
MRRLQQVLVVLAGCVAAGIMIALGWWQLQVYEAQGAESAAARADQPAVPIDTVAQAGSAVRDGYGRPVSATGRYLADDQVLVPLPDATGAYRVVTGLRLDDGSVLPVVRGVVRGDLVAVRPPPPTDVATPQIGVLLPSEEAAGGIPPAGQLGSVRVPALAQLWSAPLIDGYLVLGADDATRQGLEPAPLLLPEGSGRLRNGAYAVQWWIFAAFAVAMAARIARDLGERTDIDRPIVSTP